MTADIITAAVFIAFVCLAARKHLLPRLAARRAGKAGNAPEEASSLPADLTALRTALPAAAFPAGTPRQAVCFDMRILDLSAIGSGGDSWERHIAYAANEMLLGISVRGAVVQFGMVCPDPGTLILYAAYAAG